MDLVHGLGRWMYRLIVESLLGLKLEVDKLRFAPCLPADWKGFKVYYRYRETVYEIDVRQQPGGEGRTIVTVDGMEQQDEAIPLVDDRRNRSVEIVVPRWGLTDTDGPSTIWTPAGVLVPKGAG